MMDGFFNVSRLPGLRRMLACGVLAVCSSGASAAWPDKPIKLVVPYPAGGNADVTARLLATHMGNILDQTIVVDNRPGGSGSIGAAAVAKAPADGYTLLLDATSFAVNPSLLPGLSYDAARDFTPVSLITRVPLLVVAPAQSEFKSLQDVVKIAAAKPGAINYASAGNGSAQHLAGELFSMGTKISMTHIPYRGGAPALTDLAGGQIDLMFSATSASGPLVKAGKLRALAITAAEPVADWDLPTVSASVLPDFQVYEWNGLFVPSGTPADIVAKLGQAVQKALAAPEVIQRFSELGVQAVGSSAEEFSAFVSTETARWAEVIRSANISTQ
ncbi:tripartite tricarboxylate transporter substrate binding protein [Paracandidimonas soli]|uniref:Tripartite-type tricarboxylate transporter receptor subunit TctC n=2 Tax=Paracandidimonas soli TaxID=1917182 RepID=A0A4R3VCE1_9BURK|nr:tripartite-type tricarboxylate transporter receptor subunit TctC [Paracandidimonas soli]